MAQMINTNIASLNAQRNLTTSQNSLATSLQRLSSGLRINSAKDDAAGMAIANRMTSQINGLTQAARNANDGISLAQTAEGAMQAISDNLQRMRDLSVQAANASTTAPDRISINNEVQQLSEEIQRVASSTSFNGTKLLDGTFNAQTFQVGANRGDTININSIANMQTSQLGSAGSTFAASVTGTATTAALTAGDLTLNGFQVGASQLGAAPGQSAASAFSVAAAINAISPNSGVTATANATTIASAAPTAFTALGADLLSINGVSVGAIAAGGTVDGQGANVAAAINLVSSQTGVTAASNATTGVVTLTAADGRDIILGQPTAQANAAAVTAATAAVLAATGLTAGSAEDLGTPAAATASTTHGTVTLSSSSATGIVLSGGAVASGGFTAATTTASVTSTVSSIAGLNVLTSSAASNAIEAIDGALATVDSARGSLGAYQNRFASAVSNLQVTTENLTASRSRILDTDFATETAALTRAQILQQAGTAMLAQANSVPNGVMALLR